MILKTADWKVTKFISKFIKYTWRILSFRHVHVDTNANLKPQICDRPVLMVTSLMPRITKLLRFYSKELQPFSCYVHLSYRVTFLCKNPILHDDQVKHSDKRFREWEALAFLWFVLKFSFATWGFYVENLSNNIVEIERTRISTDFESTGKLSTFGISHWANGHTALIQLSENRRLVLYWMRSEFQAPISWNNSLIYRSSHHIIPKSYIKNSKCAADLYWFVLHSQS